MQVYLLIIDERVFKFDFRSAVIAARDRNACFRVTLGLSRYRVIALSAESLSEVQTMSAIYRRLSHFKDSTK